MRPFIILLTLTWICQQAMSQSPDRLSYQAVIRNASGNLVTSQNVGVRMSVIRGSSSGTTVYAETHQGTTSSTGVLMLEIGSGSVVSGTFSGIVWSQGPFYVRVEVDPSGGSNYQVVGSTQLLSVPYALFSKSSALKYSTTGDTLYSGTEYVIVPGISAANQAAMGLGTASITTTPATNVVETTATIGGQITNQGTTAVTTRGICYALTGSPTTSNFTVTSGSGTGTFQVNLTGLTGGSVYYARAFAINSNGTSYGNQVMFTTTGPNPGTCTGTVKDIDGNEYGVVSIGSQCWMKENLRVTKFRNGAAIPLDSSGGVNGDGAGQTWGFLGTPGRTLYNHSQANLLTFGFLYNKWTINDSRGVCPAGWHVPTPLDWAALALQLGGHLVAGGKMKSTGTAIWRSPNEGADNSSNFTGYPGGRREVVTGKFVSKGEIGFFWSTGTGGSDFSHELQFDRRVLSNPTIGYSWHEFNGYSIRCIRD